MISATPSGGLQSSPHIPEVGFCLGTRLQTALLRTIVGGYEPQQAIDAPAFHTTSMPGSFWPRTWTPGIRDRAIAEAADTGLTSFL
ncbi:gamma-glutamyltranspeptidase [Microbacterium amylolyticum]|uniref:Gamma-glutamyltranspeptidase n=1 Tax=Microbacterium amylolyticum TaxID=936337 RepID=A0ABS4ZJJ5_9MICO|nr:gamma-glutamyltranspeptidase [Microbacterium amylolyticum]